MRIKLPSGREVNIDTSPALTRVSSTAEAKPRSFVSNVWNYSAAVKRWKAAGSPSRSQDEIDRIVKICEGCMFFRRGKVRNSCGLCGCSLNHAPNGLVNKVAMATESCPANPPKWVASCPDNPANQSAPALANHSSQ